MLLFEQLVSYELQIARFVIRTLSVVKDYILRIVVPHTQEPSQVGLNVRVLDTYPQSRIEQALNLLHAHSHGDLVVEGYCSGFSVLVLHNKADTSHLVGFCYDTTPKNAVCHDLIGFHILKIYFLKCLYLCFADISL